MAKILDMPKLSPTMEEGVLSAWHKKEGDAVQVDDLLAEVETDKATMEFRAFDKGTLLKILITPGTQVKLGQPVAILGNPGEDLAPLLAQAGAGGTPTAAPPTPKSKADDPPRSKTDDGPKIETAPKAKTDGGAAAPPVAETMAPPRVAGAQAQAEGRVSSGGALDRTEREGPAADASIANGRPMASPYVRKAARDRGIDLTHVQGSGPGGRIVAQDLDAPKRDAKAIVRSEPTTLQGAGAAPNAADGARLAAPEARPLSMMRKTIARRLTESKQTVPHFYLTIDVDAGELVKLREEINAELAGGAASTKKPEPEAKPLKISLNDLLIKACATALTRVPECNAQFSPEAILVHKRVDISVAVAIPDGLVTPVVRDADRKSVVRIAEEVRELAARARAKKLKPEEMSDGTFSISNLGMFGIDEFSAVINPPEGAILAIGQARDEAVVREGQIVAGKRMAMTLSCDHRAIDGAVGAAFLAELRALIERPMRILAG